MDVIVDHDGDDDHGDGDRSLSQSGRLRLTCLRTPPRLSSEVPNRTPRGNSAVTVDSFSCRRLLPQLPGLLGGGARPSDIPITRGVGRSPIATRVATQRRGTAKYALGVTISFQWENSGKTGSSGHRATRRYGRTRFWRPVL